MCRREGQKAMALKKGRKRKHIADTLLKIETMNKYKIENLSIFSFLEIVLFNHLIMFHNFLF